MELGSRDSWSLIEKQLSCLLFTAESHFSNKKTVKTSHCAEFDLECEDAMTKPSHDGRKTGCFGISSLPLVEKCCDVWGNVTLEVRWMLS